VPRFYPRSVNLEVLVGNGRTRGRGSGGQGGRESDADGPLQSSGFADWVPNPSRNGTRSVRSAVSAPWLPTTMSPPSPRLRRHLVTIYMGTSTPLQLERFTWEKMLLERPRSCWAIGTASLESHP
jgi:hypothetical protein